MRRRASLAPLLGLAGCGTIGSLAVGGSGVPLPPGTKLWPLGPVYCGVVMDLRLIGRGTPTGRALAAIDLPLSLALDTLLLPLTVPLWLVDRAAAPDRDAPPWADVAPVRSS